MGAGVLRTLVEPHARDETVDAGLEFQSQFNRRRVRIRENRWNGRIVPYAAGTSIGVSGSERPGDVRRKGIAGKVGDDATGTATTQNRRVRRRRIESRRRGQQGPAGGTV